jgi:NACHT N-terminal Helical domain 7
MGTPRGSPDLRDGASRKGRRTVPLPTPDLPYASLTNLKTWFAEEAAHMGRHLTGLAVWDRADERSRRTLTDLLERRLPGAGLACPISRPSAS